MIKNIAIGGSLAFAAAVQPGPFQAYLLSRVAAIGWRRTLPAAFAPLITDGPIAGLALLVLGNLSPEAQSALRLAGGVFLLYLAWGSLRQWLQKNTPGPERVDRAPKTILEAALEKQRRRNKGEERQNQRELGLRVHSSKGER